MTSEKKQALVIGGTGVQGQPVVREFLGAGFPTRLITRKPEQTIDLQSAGAEIFKGDLGEARSLQPAFENVDILALIIPFFIAPPATPAQYMENILAAAKAAQVKQIIWNTGGPLLDHDTGVFSMDFRRPLFDMLKQSGIPFTVFIPPTYMENLAGPWTTQGLLQNQVLGYPILEEDGIGWITVNDVAKLMVAAAKNNGTDNQVYRINGPEYLTGTQLAEIFSDVLGHPIQYQAWTPDEFGEQLAAVLGEQAGKMIAEDYRYIQPNQKQLMPYQDMKSVLEKFPIELTPIKMWLQQMLPLFQGQQS